MSNSHAIELDKIMKREVTVAAIDREALRFNYQQLKSCLHEGVRMLGVVKADGYGHGSFEVAKIALGSGVDYLAVARFSEAIELREGGIDSPILLLGSILPDLILDGIKNNITFTINNSVYAQFISEIAKGMGLTATVHIKVDTGMGRLGICVDSLLVNDSEVTLDRCLHEIKSITSLPNLKVEGLFTHFASADLADKSYAKTQFSYFLALVKKTREIGLNIPLCHCANSAAIIEMPETHLDMVRCGVVQYGLWPSDECDRNLIELKPVMSLYSTLLHIKEVPEDFKISYASTYSTEKPQKIATVAIGYADGFFRSNSNNGEMLVNGKRCKIVGRVCMDLTLIDVTDVDCTVGDRVVIFGKSVEEEITADEIADRIGTINYEIVTFVGKRVPRIYLGE